MSAPKPTPWFPGHIKPVRPGVYHTNAADHTYQYWTGRHWSYYMPTPQEAAHWKGVRSMVQSPKWCGLAEQPK